MRPLSEDLEKFLHSLLIHYDDVTGIEPELIRRYDDVLPRIDDTLGPA